MQLHQLKERIDVYNEVFGSDNSLQKRRDEKKMVITLLFI
jgi:hypothetical protein